MKSDSDFESYQYASLKESFYTNLNAYVLSTYLQLDPTKCLKYANIELLSI